jgi:hypothetical protein
VAVSVMQVGVMRMGVAQWPMPVPMRVRIRHRSVMRVLMVRVVPMAVLMLERFVLVLVLMAFGEVHP